MNIRQTNSRDEALIAFGSLRDIVTSLEKGYIIDLNDPYFVAKIAGCNGCLQFLAVIGMIQKDEQSMQMTFDNDLDPKIRHIILSVIDSHRKMLLA